MDSPFTFVVQAVIIVLLAAGIGIYLLASEARQERRNLRRPRFPDAFTRGGTLRVLLVDTDGNARTRTYERSFLATQADSRILRLDGLLAQLKTKSMSEAAMERINDGEEDFATPLIAVFTALSRLSDYTNGYDLTGNGLPGAKGRVAILRAGGTDYEDFPEHLAEAIAPEVRRLIAERGL